MIDVKRCVIEIFFFKYWICSYSLSSNNFCLSLAVPDSDVSSGAVAGIVVAVVLLVAAAAVAVGVFYCRRKSYTPVPQNVIITYS